MPRGPTALPTNEEQLACRAQQGCSASFEALVRRFQVPLLGFLRRRFPDADAEDLVQETFLRAYQNLHRYRTSWRFSTWLFTIARRASLNAQRKRRPRADSEAIESVPGDTPSPGHLADREESRRALWDLAASVLSERQHTALWLYYAEEMPVKEIARVVGRSRVAVKTMLFRARRKMLPFLEDSEAPRSVNDRGARPRTSPCQSAAECTDG
jgi:RNA polymerase sigma-70 factor (ECF subfamily)